jgi:cell division protein FtsW
MPAPRQPRTTSAPALRHAPDYALLTAVLMLLVIGLIAVYSSSYALGYVQFDDANYFIKRQVVFAGIGMIGLLVAMSLDYHYMRGLSPLLMLVALAGLAAVLLPGIGHESNGAQRWVQLGPLPPVQPSEFAKLAVLVYMAAWLAAKGVNVRDLSLGVFPFVSMVGIVGALIMLEPDLGTAVMIAAITGALFFVAGARLSHVAALAGAGLITLTVLILLGGYRVNRILSFTSAEDDPSGLGFHTLQLLVAFGSGGWTGLGLGVSRQKFFYVPGSHTDGVLAIIGEELGLVGVLTVLGLFAVVLWHGWLIARRADSRFGSLLAVGVTGWIGFQTLINVCGVLRLLPLTGIPLPFLSYGGSSLAVTLTGIGLLLGVSRYAYLDGKVPEAPVRGAVRVPAARAAARGSR